MSFSLIPPEINSALMYQGAGSGPLLEAATAWNGLAADLEATATQYQTAITNLTTGTWLGPSSAHMAAAAEPYIGWLQSTAAEAAQTGAQAQAAAGAYQTAYASMVPPPLITANRAELATLVSNNFLGQNTGAIAQNEAEYLDMWIQDALGMDTYQVNSTGASAALPAQTAAPLVTSGSQRAGRGGRSSGLRHRRAHRGEFSTPLRPYLATRGPPLSGRLGAPTLGTWLPRWSAGWSRTPQPRCCRCRPPTTWACWAARPLVCS